MVHDTIDLIFAAEQHNLTLHPDLIKAISKMADIDKVSASGPGSHVVLICLPQWCAQSRQSKPHSLEKFLLC